MLQQLIIKYLFQNIRIIFIIKKNKQIRKLQHFYSLFQQIIQLFIIYNIQFPYFLIFIKYQPLQKFSLSQILLILLNSFQDEQCNNHGTYDETTETCICDLGYNGTTCDNQYCQWDDYHNGFCAGEYAGICNDTTFQCDCNESAGFISTGANCIVSKSDYVSTVPDWVLLGFGIASVVLAGIWLIYKFRHGNKLEQNYEKLDSGEEQPIINQEQNQEQVNNNVEQ